MRLADKGAKEEGPGDPIYPVFKGDIVQIAYAVEKILKQ